MTREEGPVTNPPPVLLTPADTTGNTTTPTTTYEGLLVLNIAGQTYTLTGTLGDGLVLEYHADWDKAISLGPVGSIAGTIATQLGFPELGNEITTELGKVAQLTVLGPIATLLTSASARITDLEINTQTSTYGVGLALDFTQLPAGSATPSLFGITLLALGFKVTRTKPASTTPTPTPTPTS